jgi:hypothetical protein
VVIRFRSDSCFFFFFEVIFFEVIFSVNNDFFCFSKSISFSANASTAPFAASMKQTVKLNTLFTATTYSALNENSVAQGLSWDMGTDQFGYLGMTVVCLFVCSISFRLFRFHFADV